MDRDSPVHAVQREATAVLQHLFRFGSARRTDQRGRAVNYADGALTVVDDDDILANLGNVNPSSGSAGAATARPATAKAAGVTLERATSSDFPQLDGEGASVQASAPGGNWASRGG